MALRILFNSTCEGTPWGACSQLDIVSATILGTVNSNRFTQCMCRAGVNDAVSKIVVEDGDFFSEATTHYEVRQVRYSIPSSEMI